VKKRPEATALDTINLYFAAQFDRSRITIDAESQLLEKEASKEQKAEHEYQGVNYDFDKTHEILYPQWSLERLRASN
jgi:hypothetical protein